MQVTHKSGSFITAENSFIECSVVSCKELDAGEAQKTKLMMFPLSRDREDTNTRMASWGRGCQMVVLIVSHRLNIWAKVLNGGSS